MRLAPIPLFFYRSPKEAVHYSGESCRLTFGQNGTLAIDICRYYGALIVAALHGEKKEELLHNNFYEQKFQLGWFGNKTLHEDVLRVAHGSYKKNGGYDEGIRGTMEGIVVLEAALWAFWSDNGSYTDGAKNFIMLGKWHSKKKV